MRYVDADCLLAANLIGWLLSRGLPSLVISHLLTSYACIISVHFHSDIDLFIPGKD